MRHLALLVLLAACVSPVTSGVEGRVLAGPTCPVQRPDSPCPDRPVAIALLIEDERGATVAHVTSDADGHFRIALPPGRYVVRSEKPGPPFLKPVAFVVELDRATALDLRADTGIR